MGDLASLTSEQCEFDNVAYVKLLLEETDDAVLRGTLVRALKLEDSAAERHRTDAWVDAATSDFRLVQRHMFPPLACSKILTLLQAVRKTLVEHPGPHHCSIAACAKVLKRGAVSLVTGAEHTLADDQERTSVRRPSVLTGHDAALVARHAHREILTPARLLRETHRRAPRASRKIVQVPLMHAVKPLPLGRAVPLHVAHENEVKALFACEDGCRQTLIGAEGLVWDEAQGRHAVEVDRSDDLRDHTESAADSKRALGRQEFSSVLRSFALTVKQSLNPAGEIEARLRGLEAAFAEPVAVGGKK